jgi:hypothetical protein
MSKKDHTKKPGVNSGAREGAADAKATLLLG